MQLKDSDFKGLVEFFSSIRPWVKILWTLNWGIGQWWVITAVCTDNDVIIHLFLF